MCSKATAHIKRPGFYRFVYFVISENATLSFNNRVTEAYLRVAVLSLPRGLGNILDALVGHSTQICRVSSILGDGDTSADDISGCLTKHVVVSREYNSNKALFDRGRDVAKLNING